MSETERMSFDDPIPQLADAFRGLELAPLQTPMEQMCYVAGFEAGRKRAGTWRRIAAMIALAAGGMVAWDRWPAQHSRAPEIVRRTDDSKLAAPSSAEQTFSPVITADNLRLREAVLSQGWDALPAPASDEPPPPRPLETLPSDSHLRRT